MKKINILLAEEYNLVRDIWTTLLNNDGRFHVIATSSNIPETLQILSKGNPDVLILDIQTSAISIIETVCTIGLLSPGKPRILVVSSRSQPEYAQKIMQSGATGFVTKNSSKQELLSAITEVHRGKKYLCREIVDNFTGLGLGYQSHPHTTKLTERELEIIKFIKIGQSSKEIAAILQIAFKTVEVHRHNILKKLNLSNSSALVNYMNQFSVFK